MQVVVDVFRRFLQHVGTCPKQKTPSTRQQSWHRDYLDGRYMHVIVLFIAVYISCHDSSRVADDISSEVQIVTHMSAVTDELAATRVSVRSRK